jgi:mannose-6-phosphate isomerase-like protein (cupin superfamily)
LRRRRHDGARFRFGHRALRDERLTKGTAMKGYVDNIERATVANEDFRRVLYTGSNLQLVLMTLPPGCDIGEEVHDDRDQFFRIEEGEGEIRIDGVANSVEDDFAVIVPAGARHNVINTGRVPLRLYTLYGPPEHRDGVVHTTKEQAERDHDNDHWDGGTTE